ncbi:MAG: hypothetical protein JNM62_07590 [Flavobacteriales bacterium]|nr:hypothetical protein [Flavobacteriales bacterium]
MNRRLLLLIVVVALGAVAWWLSRNSAPTTLDRPLSDFAVPDTGAVTRIFIADQHGRTIDLKRSAAGWTVNDKFAAKEHDVNLLLRTFKRVEVKSPVPKAAEAKMLRVMGAVGKKVEIYQGGAKPSKIWIVGHGTKDHFGTYALLEKPDEGRSNAPFILGMTGFTGILSTRFHTDLDIWRSSAYFKLNELRDLASVKLETPLAPANSYTILQDPTGSFSLLDVDGRPYRFDTVLVNGAILSTKQLNYEEIQREPTYRDSLLKTTPNHVLTFTKRDGEVTRLKFWYQPYRGEDPPFGVARPLFDELRMDAVIQDTLLVVVQRPALERMLQPISNFRP